ncbi:16S rRNA (cytidine(1402)-2'-O)-methyltransferase [Candidatus Peregrinibacteria bacterium]|nr:16S rRNA (cytidine(1402)-2'-O)-methyltransferase [Candidatus Peregrinibacteria bacterium]
MALYIVSTPIGNLEDITIRAINTLKAVDFIAAEDTRHSIILLNKYEIRKPLLSFHSHSGGAKIDKIIENLKQEKSCALITDAGTPGISDPAYSLIKAAIAENIRIIPVPGPAAFLAALVGTGLPMNEFIYMGFLPIKKGRQTLLNRLKDEEKTVIFYESPHRLQKTLVQLEEYLGPDRKIVVARELTKIHEEFIRGTVSEAREHFEKHPVKGEITIVLSGSTLK